MHKLTPTNYTKTIGKFLFQTCSNPHRKISLDTLKSKKFENAASFPRGLRKCTIIRVLEHQQQKTRFQSNKHGFFSTSHLNLFQFHHEVKKIFRFVVVKLPSINYFSSPSLFSFSLISLIFFNFSIL